MLTRRQNGIYRPLVKAAFAIYCRKGGTDKFDPWYRKELVNALGIYTTKEVKDQAQLDELCIHFATLSGDRKEIDYWTRAQERRALWRLQATMRNAGVDWPYVNGIAHKMGYDRDIATLPAELILKINTALYLHWKRKQKALA